MCIEDIDIEWVQELAYKNQMIQNGYRDGSRPLAKYSSFDWQLTDEDALFWNAIAQSLRRHGKIDIPYIKLNYPEGHKAYNKLLNKITLDRYIKLI